MSFSKVPSWRQSDGSENMPPQPRHQLTHAFYWTRSSQINLCAFEWPPQVQAWGCFLRQAPETSPSLSPFHTHSNTLPHSLCLSPLCPLTGELLRQCSPHLRLWATHTEQQDYSPLPYLWIKSKLKYIGAKDRWPAHTGRKRKTQRGVSYLVAAPMDTPSPAFSSLVDGSLPRGAF